ncbi:MAG TPA: hypothetical protein PKA05_17540, partial [Roseiflexaceae bacterium]|nr:hypothetical protein [Roseiflexaceae bacterium]
WRRRLRAALPHLLTATAAVAVSLTLQLVIVPAGDTAPPPSTPTVPPVVMPSPVPTSAPPPTPAATAPALSAGISRQELLDLRAEDDRIWVAIYYARAISQIAEAEAALRINSLNEVDLALIAVDDSLSLARDRSVGAERNPIEQLRRDVGGMREDLYLRPEAMDTRLARLRQAILALIGQRR